MCVGGGGGRGWGPGTESSPPRHPNHAFPLQRQPQTGHGLLADSPGPASRHVARILFPGPAELSFHLLPLKEPSASLPPEEGTD